MDSAQNSIYTVTHLYVATGTREFGSREAAETYVREAGFSARIKHGGKTIAHWCPISGWSRVRA